MSRYVLNGGNCSTRGYASFTWRTFVSGVLLWVGLMLVAVFPVYAQTAASDTELISLLNRLQSSARELDYSGIYVHNHNGRIVSSRIVHVVDGTGERERLEILDGPPREYVQHNSQVQCLMPESKTVKLEQERTDRFPGLLLADASRISQSYEAFMNVASQRVAGRDCQVTELKARDNRRYDYRICTDEKTNLLLKFEAIAPGNKIVEQIVFTSVDIGKGVPHALLAPSWDTKGWRVVEAVMEPVDIAGQGWRIPSPPGFEPAMQVKRTMVDRRHVDQLVLTDGLAAISVFIEPARPNSGDAFESSRHEAGAVNMHRTRIGDYWVTVLGEVPASTLRDIVERTEFVPLAR